MSIPCNMPFRCLLLASVLLVSIQAGAQNIQAGKTKARQCVACHGETGLSKLPNAPNLAGQPEIYLVEQLKAYRSGRRVNDNMSLLARPLSDADIADLAAWFAAIQVQATPPQ